MKHVAVILFLLNFNVLSGQNKSDLRIAADSIILHQIGYLVDSTTNKLPSNSWDSTKVRSLYPSFSSFPSKPMTTIILDQKKIEIEELNYYTLFNVEIVKIFGKNDKTAMALYGLNAKNGLIILRSKN